MDTVWDPVVLVQTGITYCRPCLRWWFASGGESCPATGQALSSKSVATNYIVRQLVGRVRGTSCPQPAQEQRILGLLELFSPPAGDGWAGLLPPEVEDALLLDDDSALLTLPELVALLGPGYSSAVQERAARVVEPHRC